jgi:serine phosphatase RsbU (regulator of sigma subunit)
VQIPFGAQKVADPDFVAGGSSGAQNDRDDPGIAEATLVLCGHPAPFLVHGTDTEPVASAPCSLPLGLGSLVAEPYAATAISVPFGPGDSLVLYTDGVSDARARCGAFFPLESLLRGVCDLPPDTVAGFLRGRLLGHMQGELNDDAALLVLRREG